MVPKKIIKFLEKGKVLPAGRQVKYEIVKHKTVYTAYDKAQTLKVPEKMIGKTLVFKTDGKLAMALIPANKNLDKEKIKKLLKAKKVDLVSERLIKNKFKGVKVGAIPPFGNLWGLGTFADKSLINQPKIILNGGDYNFSIKISPVSFKKLIPELVIGSFSKPR
jgi:Ala-tRNA(Pro) deacylase